MSEIPQPVARSWRLAQSLRRVWEPRWQRLVELAMPYRTTYFGSHGTPNMPAATIYDETGLNAVSEFANRLQTGLMPDGTEWGQLTVLGATEAQRAQIAGAMRYVFDLLAVSNFSTEVNDFYHDLAGPGNACLRCIGGDWRSPLSFQAIPLPHVYVTPGPHGGWGDIHVLHSIPAYVLRAQWPDAQVPEEWAKRPAEECLPVWDSWIRDLDSPTERWVQHLHIDGKVPLLTEQHSGHGSCEYVFARWIKGAGELYGVGQGLMALPAMEVANELVRMLFSNAQMNLAGLWQAEDDGVLNPWTVRLIPGAIVPIAQGSKGLMPLNNPGGRFDLSQIQLNEQRQQIKKALYSEALGPREGTPPTALEIEQRLAELARAIGPAISRVWQEAGVAILTRMRYVLDKKGLATLPLIDGRRARALPMSALARAQKGAVVQRVAQWGGMVSNLFGPAAVSTLVDAEKVARFSAEQMGVPADLIRTPEEIAAQARAAGEALAQNPDAAGPLLAALSGGAKAGAQPA